MDAAIPDKLYFRIGEVADIPSLKPSVLRLWETEFKALRPGKSRTGQRLYTRKDIETVLELKRLLYGEKLTIAGARRRLGSRRRQESDEGEGDLVRLVREVRDELIRFRESLGQ